MRMTVPKLNEETLALLCRCRWCPGVAKHHCYVAAFVGAGYAVGGGAIGGDLQVSHAAENAENLTRCRLGVRVLHLGDFGFAYQNAEGRRRRFEELRDIFGRDVSDEV